MRHTLRFPLLAAVFFAALILLSPRAGEAAQITISMTDNQFSPKNITINAGDTVTWVNNGTMAHTATADGGSFDSGTLQPGQSFSATFSATGAYLYYCKFHGARNGIGMAGAITVISPVASSAGAASGSANTSANANTNLYASPNAVTVAQLQAQLQTLLNQISVLQGQAGNTLVPTASTAYDSSSCPLVGRSLKRGSSGEDVTRLQQFLARDPSVYPEGTVSGYYGALTERAVQRWQVKYNIVSSGTPAETGYGVVGPRTAAAISILCTTGSYAGVPGPSAPVGGYITVTPISGAAPLSVNITATVNTTNSCALTVYTLDFGDGMAPQQITSGGGSCGQSSHTFTHVYTYGGTYQVKLSAGAHATTATVLVSGQPAPSALVCPPGYQATLVGGTNVCVQTSAPASAPYSYGPPVVSAAPAEPLTFTIQFDLPSSCTGYDVAWGDGTAHNTQSDGGSSCAQGASVKSINHTYPSASSYTITLKRGATLGRQDDVGITITQ